MGITKNQHRKPTNPGSWGFGGADIPRSVTNALGAAIAEWGYLEQTMDALLSVTLGKPEVGRVLREQLRTITQRQAILAEIVGVALPDDDAQKVRGLMGEFKALQKERGLFVHGVWGNHSGHPEDALLIMDDVVFRAHHLPTDPADMMKAMAEMMRLPENCALVSVQDLERFRHAVSDLTTRLAGAVNEIDLRQRQAV